MNVINSKVVKDANELTAMREFTRASNANVNNISFKTLAKTITLNNVSEVDFIGGADSKDIKTDIRITYDGGKVFNVSLKKPSFKAWESADSLIGDAVAEKILEYLLDEVNNPTSMIRSFKPVSYIQGGKVRYRIVKRSGNSITSVAFKCGTSDATRVIFGTDILGRGAVISNDFNSGSIINGQTLEINVSGIYQVLSEIPNSIFPYFQVNSVKETRNRYRFPGLRVEAKPLNALSNSIKIEIPLR